MWHYRLRHLINEVLTFMLAKSQISHAIDDVHKMYTTSIHRKIAKKPFSVESSSFNRIHTDV